MNYSEETAIRLLRAVVDDGSSLYVPPVRREVLRTVLDAFQAQERELALLRQLTAEQRRATNAAQLLEK